MRRAFTLSQKLLTLGVIGLLPTIIAGGVGYLGVSRTADAALRLDQAVTIQRAQMQADMMHDALRGVAALARLEAAAGHAEATKELVTESHEKREMMLAEIDTVRLTAGDSLVRAIATTLRPDVVKYVELATKVTESAARQDPNTPALAAQLDTVFFRLETELSALGDRVEVSSAALSANAMAVARKVRIELAILCVIALIAMSLTARAIIRAIRAPISEMARHAESMAVGDFTSQIAYESNDEIGSLATSLRAVTTFAQETAAAATALSHGDLSRTVTPRSDADVLAQSVNRSAETLRKLDAEIGTLIAAGSRGDLRVRANADGFDGAYRELVRGVNAMIDELVAPAAEATSVLDRVARRDLRVRVEGTYLGEHARLTSSLNSTLDQLESALREVNSASTEVTNVANEIAGGSQAMAEGASEQASGLEEINASLQELDGLSRRTTTEAQEVLRLSDSARSTADRGVAHMKNLDIAMDAISASVNESAKIMRTIDEIAFQTNLLALNAAVEAARAGDAGRGFAVVADEVRTLALRSKEEARRSAEVIERSLADSARGVELKDETQKQLAEIASTVGRVSAAMHSIAQSSAQQAEGIGQILAGTDQLSVVTQQAAASAEESAAAAQELTSQAESLNDLVGRFELSQGVEGGYSEPIAPQSSRATSRRVSSYV